MSKQDVPHPTGFELQILKAIWENGPSTVREVHGALGGDDSRGYTTVLKTMQIMHGKDLLLRDDSSKAHRYAARHPAETTKAGLVADLLDRVFEGSSTHLIQFALSTRPADAAELKNIRELIERAERGEK